MTRLAMSIDPVQAYSIILRLNVMLPIRIFALFIKYAMFGSN